MIRIILFFLCFILSSSSYAQGGDHARARLISSYESVGTFAALEMGLELSLDEKWYTYWRTPGDAGLAPQFDWTGSTNVKNVEVQWPAPHRYTAFDMHSFGYSDIVIFPLKVTPEKPGEAVSLHVKADIVVCHEICIPQTLTAEINLPPGPAKKSVDQAFLRKAIAALPVQENTRDIGVETAILGKDAITVIAYSKEGWEPGADLFIEAPNVTLTSVPEIMPQNEGNKAVIKIKGPEGADLTSYLLGKEVTVVLTKDGRALERKMSF